MFQLTIHTLYTYIHTHIYIYIYSYIYIYIHLLYIYYTFHTTIVCYPIQWNVDFSYIYIYILYILYIYTIYTIYIPLDHYRCWRIWQTLCTHDSWEADPSCLLPHIPRTFCLTIMQIIHVILLCILILNTNYTCNITLYPDTGDRTCHPVSHILHASIPFQATLL